MYAIKHGCSPYWKKKIRNNEITLTVWNKFKYNNGTRKNEINTPIRKVSRKTNADNTTPVAGKCPLLLLPFARIINKLLIYGKIVLNKILYDREQLPLFCMKIFIESFGFWVNGIVKNYCKEIVSGLWLFVIRERVYGNENPHRVTITWYDMPLDGWKANTTIASRW